MPRGEAWSEQEVALTVADYIDMLLKELRGEAYSKTEHRQSLISKLSGRSGAAIERKHENISAVLIELGMPAIDGYKPLSNYQRILKDHVSKWLAAHPGAIGGLEAIADREPDRAPLPGDLDGVFVAPPEREHGEMIREYSSEGRISLPGDLGRREARNRTLGLRGEEFVVELERSRLLMAGREDLSGAVEWVSRERGDGLGFDVRSYDLDEREKLIEVKTTNYGKRFSFFVTDNEVRTSEERAEQYSLYRLFNFSNRPSIYCLKGSIREHFSLEPKSYLARR